MDSNISSRTIQTILELADQHNVAGKVQLL